MTSEEIKKDQALVEHYRRLMSLRDTLKLAFPSAWKIIFESMAHPDPKSVVGNGSPRCLHSPLCYPLKPSGNTSAVAVAGVDTVRWDIDKKTGLAVNFEAHAKPYMNVFGDNPERIKVSEMEGMRLLLELADNNQPSKKTRWYEDDDRILD